LSLGVEVVEQGKQVAIAKLLEGGPAALAGMMPGDVIAAVGKKPVHSYTELVALVSTLRPGDDVPVDIVRGNKTGAVEVQVVRGKPGVEDVVLVAATDQPLAADRPAPATLEQEVRDLRARVDMLEQIVARLVKELSAQRR
jgi:C-terminal processing protease CtpA/Prc